MQKGLSESNSHVGFYWRNDGDQTDTASLTDVIWVWSDYLPFVILRCCTWWSFKENVVAQVEDYRLNFQYSWPAQISGVWLPWRLNLLRLHPIFSAQLLQFLSFHTKMCVRSQAPSIKHQITAIFTGRSAIVGLRYVTPFVSLFWLLDFWNIVDLCRILKCSCISVIYIGLCEGYLFCKPIKRIAWLGKGILYLLVEGWYFVSQINDMILSFVMFSYTF